MSGNISEPIIDKIGKSKRKRLDVYIRGWAVWMSRWDLMVHPGNIVEIFWDVQYGYQGWISARSKYVGGDQGGQHHRIR